jgi:glycosyltransferase involved in cell wall biosynthesis
VSIIIPVLDGAAVIGEQLAALRDQDYAGDWEVIVADNGSTDGTLAVIAALEPMHRPLRVVDASERRGPSFARNVGARAAAGDVLLFLDADDVVEPTWLSAMAHQLAAADFVVSTDLPSGRQLPLPRHPAKQPNTPRWARGGNVGIRTEMFWRLGGWDERRRVGEDVEFCWRAQREGCHMIVAADARVFYRQPSSLSSMIRKRYSFGESAPGLFREYGIPRRVLRRLVDDLFRLAARSPDLFAGKELRLEWIGSAAGMLGRLRAEVALLFMKLKRANTK